MAEETDASRAAYQAGRTKLRAGDIEGAISALEQSVTDYPHFKSLELLGEAFLRAGKPRRAIVPLAAATTLNDQVCAPSLLAEALLASGDELDAHRTALLALKRDPANSNARRVCDSTREADGKAPVGSANGADETRRLL